MLNADALKRWYAVHKWTSLVCTLFLLMLCLTGLPLIFRDELTFWLGDAIEPPEQVTASAPVDLNALVQDAKARRPQDAVKFLTKDDEYPMWFVSLGETPMAQDNSALYMYDTRTGEFLKEFPIGHGLVYVLLTLHVEMFAGLPGTLFLGFMGLVFVASVVSGIVVYGPFMRKLPFGTVRRERSTRLAWLDLHNLLGIVTVTWVLVVGVTGVINTLDRPLLGYWQMTEIVDMLTPWQGKPAPATVIPVDRAIQAAEASAPELAVRFVAFPGTPFAGAHHYMVFMRGHTPLTARLLTPILIDAETAHVSDSRKLPWYLTALLLSQPLHFGNYGEMPLKLIWSLLDLITIVVLGSGVYLWWAKRTLSVDQILSEHDMPVGMVPPSATSR
ncbi:MAG: PepSY domain-containing protein [Nitrospira sp.]|nr:PepSY domain-containing protein [Nitrospira sp.]